MSNEGAGQANGSQGNGTPPQDGSVQTRVQILGQFVRDLSFENPGAPANLPARPQIELGVDLQARNVEQDIYEVELKLRVSATAESKPVFLLELVYAAMLQIQNMPPQILEQFLLIEAPRMMFPFARRIVADAIRDGGMPPLMMEPIDFAALYQAKTAELRQGSANVAAT